MFTVRKSGERGHANQGWLDSYHTFSFANYYDERHMAFRSLRVINEDWIDGGMGFGMHPHRDMEIVTYVLEGALAHSDSMGNKETIHAGEVQRMTAGTGVMHSEFNASQTEKAHLYQIWLLPERGGITPSYEQKTFSQDEKRGQLRLVASRGGLDGSVHINQDASLYLSALEPGEAVTHELAEGRGAWLQVVRGAVTAGGHTLTAGDALSAEGEPKLEITASESAEVLLFDLA